MKFKALIFVGLVVAASLAYAAGASNTQVAGVEVQFNQYDAANSINCSSDEQAALVDHPITVTFIVSQNVQLNYGFADLLADGSTIIIDGFTPQIVLSNEGMQQQFILVASGTLDATNTSYTSKVMAGSTTLYLKQVITRNITATNTTLGTAEMLLATNANVSSAGVCAVKGQVVTSEILP